MAYMIMNIAIVLSYMNTCFGISISPRTIQQKRAEKDGEIRLVSGPNRFNGRVEIFHKGEWGTVCDDLWDDIDARVVCRQLGFTGGTAHSSAFYGEGTGTIWLDNVECTSRKPTLKSCDSNRWGDENCSHNEDAGVSCDSYLPSYAPSLPNATVRLVNGRNPWEGRVEVYHNYMWGTVCDDDWDNRDARVVCRQLGYSNGTALVDSEYGNGVDPIYLDNVSCSGRENRLEDCRHRGWNTHNCGHYEDAGVRCETEETQKEGLVRLNGSAVSWRGRIEIHHDGKWGTVCNDYWNTADAEVVCRQLGYSGGEALQEHDFGSGTGRIWLDDVKCTGSETSLKSCPSNPWGENNCGHGEDAGVNCVNLSVHNGTNNGDIRLVNGSMDHAGRVEIFYDGRWGTICDDDWDSSEAEVVCRQMGFTGGVAQTDLQYGEGTGDILLDDVICSGEEKSVVECSSQGWEVHNCAHYEDVGVICDL